MNIDELRKLASEAGHAIGSEVHKFLDWLEGKTASPEMTVGEVQAQQAAQEPATQTAETTGEGAAQ
jgi:hypothetical protein